MLDFIDTHAHFYDEAFAGEEDLMLSKAADAGVNRVLQADVDSRERDAMFSLCERHPGRLFPMLGLYPGSVDDRWEEELAALEAYTGRGIVAIGEIGLDYHYSKDTAALQKLALRAQFQLASRLDLPVNIHLRDATEDFFAVLQECRHLGLRGNLHAFSGSKETFQRISRYGDWSVGIGGVITFKNASLPQAVAAIPLEHILLETDAPYLTPVPYRGRRNDSSYIPVIAAKIAEIKGISLEEVAAVTTANAERLFHLQPISS